MRRHWVPGTWWTRMGVLLLTLHVAPAVAQQSTEDMRREIDALKAEMRRMQALHEERLEALRGRVSSVEQKAAAPPAVPTAARSEKKPQGDILGRPIDLPLQIGLTTTLAATGSSENNSRLGNLLAGGHDPGQNGFSVQSSELSISGVVDPYFDAQATLALRINTAGETTTELEEAFFRTRALPYGLQVKGGHYFTEFGRVNSQHVHEWAFADQPIVNFRMFGGDGLRAPGARVSWLTPAPWFSEVTIGAQNSKGETARSFLGNSETTLAGFGYTDRQIRNAGDLLYSARWLNGFDLSRETSVNLGLSGLAGPNATGASTDTYIVGADFYAKWQPTENARGFPFVALQGEIMYRNFEALERDREGALTLDDWGAYLQGLWGFRPGWVLGLRGEYVNGDSASHTDSPSHADSQRDQRWRMSPNLTWYPTEFSKLRLQYNLDWAEHLNNNVHTVLLQGEFALGSHAAHKF